MIQRMQSNLWIIAIHATLIPFVFFFCLLSWSIGATLPALYAATCISAGCTLVGLAAIVLDGVCHHYGIGERMHALFDRCDPVECEIPMMTEAGVLETMRERQTQAEQFDPHYPELDHRRLDAPQEGVQYRLSGGPGVPCISNGNTWSESEVSS